MKAPMTKDEMLEAMRTIIEETKKQTPMPQLAEVKAPHKTVRCANSAPTFFAPLIRSIFSPRLKDLRNDGENHD